VQNTEHEAEAEAARVKKRLQELSHPIIPSLPAAATQLSSFIDIGLRPDGVHITLTADLEVVGRYVYCYLHSACLFLSSSPRCFAVLSTVICVIDRVAELTAFMEAP
jgi:hypothetical protein